MIRRFYFKLASFWLALFFSLVAAFIFGKLSQGLESLPPGAPSIFELQLAFTPQRFEFVTAQWGAENMQNYVSDMWLDYVYAIAYAIALSSWIAFLTHRPAHLPRRWHLILFNIPFLVAAFDYLENSLHLLILVVVRDFPAWLVFLASLSAAIKWSLAAVTILSILILIPLRLFSNARR